MTTDVRSLVFDSYTSDAAFRAWGSGLSAALQAVGLVQTTDTGQVNWTTVTRIGTQGTEVINGYEIYRLNDALQSTAPVFIKIEYGTLNGNSGSLSPIGSPALFVTVGTSTNGSGTLGGLALSSRTRLAGGAVTNATTNSTAVASPVYTQGDTSSVIMALGVSTQAQPVYTSLYSSFPAFLVIDRTRDANGVPTANGLVFATCKWPSLTGGGPPTGPTATFQLLSFAAGGLAGAVDSFWPIGIPGQGFSTGAVGADLYTWPVAVASPKAEAMMLGILGIYKGDVTLGTTLSLTVLGSTHTYLSLTSIAGITNNDAARGYVNTFQTSGAVLMRWE